MPHMRERDAHSGERSGVVITGIAAAASLGIDAESIWRAMLAGRCGIGPLTEIESELPSGSTGGQALELPAEYRPDLPREARYLRWTVEGALRDAGLDSGMQHASSRRCGVLGTTLHGMRAGGRFLRSRVATELDSFIAGATAQLAFERLEIDGGVITTCSACSSSLGAIALGVTLLESGQADVVVAGGYDAISEYSWAGFNALRLIATGPLRPFCRERQGMKVAEGYGVVVLERAHEAARRGARVRARLAGWGESADSHHLTQPHPQGEGALAAMRQALGRADVRAVDIGLVAAHATGTPDNDASEYQALSRLLGGELGSVPVVGFKSFLGHTLGGAGAVELVMSCMAMRDHCVPACPNVDAAEVEYAGLHVAAGTVLTREISCTLNTSLGFGGANTCVVLADPRRRADHRASAEAGAPAQEACITGFGIVLPGAVGHAAFQERLRRADSACARSRPALIEDDELAEFLNVRRARRMSEYVKLTLAAAAMAVRGAGLSDHPDSMVQTGAMLATMHGSANFCIEYYSQIVKEGALAANPVLFAEGVPNAAAAHLSATMGLKGACQTIIGSRTAGLDALALAAMRVRTGVVDRVIVVAAEARCAMVDRAYEAAGLLAREGSDAAASLVRGFDRSFGAVGFIIESGRAAAARGATPFARVLECAWGSPSGSGPCGSARTVASVLSRLPTPGRVIGSACRTWVDRAEKIGIRRAGLSSNYGGIHHRFGELFSVSPLVGIAAELDDNAEGTRFSVLCTDWSGAVSAVCLERQDRRTNAQS
jgi:3-oxoacyl-[acyl-carrier-protein] synthase II